MTEDEVVDLTARADIELGTSAITHNAVHLGEAATIRSLAGISLGI